jgi:hypothetical protein
MLFVCQRLGGEEGSGTSDAGPGANRIRLAKVEWEVALREAGTLRRSPASTTMVTTESPASRDSPITLSRKQTGKPLLEIGTMGLKWRGLEPSSRFG